ncbi:MAG: peptide ABC transporter substrate-binding protein [Deltaproteobacteria bacterium]|nr:peptide ABC transporter substrate-binding protein [Deltaproteobacteria bacterium]
MSEDRGTLDWSYGEVNQDVVLQLMDGLTRAGQKGEAMPAVAARWRFSGGKNPEWVFELRKDARWSDGESVCAQHFIDAWARVLSPRFASPYAHYLFDVKNAEGFHAGRIKDFTNVGLRAEGCLRLRVALERPAVFFPALASSWVLFPVRTDLIAKHGMAWTRAENLAVTGPYVLERWDRDTRFVLRRNPRYWGAPAKEERLEGVVVSDDATALMLFKKGKLDWIRDLPFLEKKNLSKLPEYRLSPAFVEYHLGFRFSGGSAGDANFTREERCALSLALDTREIPKFLGGGEIPAGSLVPEQLGGRKTPRFDPARAKALWRSASRLVGSHRLEFYAKDVHIPLMEWIQQQWKKNLGVEVKLARTEGKTYWARLQSSPPPLFLSGVTAACAHPFNFLSELMSSTSANWGRFSSKKYDELALKTAAIREDAARANAVAAAEKLLVDEECAVIPLYFRQTASLVSGRWQGFFMNPLARVNLKDVYR